MPSEGAILEHDTSYFLRRADEEREAARNSANPSVQRAHLDMAERYEAVLKAMELDAQTVVVPIRR